jgi:solute carrier family 10 (sodium/bile acid cotransporter), member 7
MSSCAGRERRRAVMSLGRRLARVDPYLAAILGTVGLASVLPASGVGASVAGDLSAGAIGLLFFLYGARLSTRAALDGMRNWRLHAAVLAATFGLFPVLGLACRLLDPGVLRPSVYAGVLFMCLLPSTVQSSIAFTSIARGNVPAAICAASFSNLLGVVLTPALAALLLGSAVEISAGSVVRIVAQLVVPFGLGQLARRRLAGRLERRRRLVGVVDRGSVLLVVYAAFSAGVVAGVWHQVTPARLVGLLVVDAAILATVLACTAYGSRRLRLDTADRIVVIFCGSKKSIATGIPIAAVLFARRDVSLIVLPAMLFHQLQLIVCAVLARRFAARADAGDVGRDGDEERREDGGEERRGGEREESARSTVTFAENPALLI